MSEARPATGPALGPTLGIALSNIATRVTTLVGTPGSTGPAFDRQNPDRFVYARLQSGVPEIYLHSISTGTAVPITAVGTAYRSTPSIDGRYVVWSDTRNGTADIYSHDLNTGTQRRLTNGSQPAVSPHVSGSTAVWQEGTQYPLPLGLHLYNLATNTPWVPLAADSRAQAVCPTITGSWVVWTKAAPTFLTNEVYAYNMATMEVRQLSTPSASDIHGCPAVNGTLVAWISYTLAGGVVETYDLAQASGPTSIIFNPMSLPNDVALSPEWVVWSDYLPGSLQLYIRPR
jgi:beta propeller repeat protein